MGQLDADISIGPCGWTTVLDAYGYTVVLRSRLICASMAEVRRFNANR